MRKKNLFTLLITLAVFAAGAFFYSAGTRSVAHALAIYEVGNLSCGSCVANIKTALGGIPGVGAVVVNLTAAQSRVEFDPDRIDADRIAAAITAAGYPAQLKEQLTTAQYRDMREEESRMAEIYVARIGSRLLSRGDLDRALARGLEEKPPQQPLADYRRQVWNEMLQQELLLNAAEINEVLVQDGEVVARIEEMRAEMENFDELIVQRYGSLEDFSRRLKRDMIINRNIEQHVIGKDVPEPQRQQVLQQWYRRLVEETPVAIYDPGLNASTTSSGSGCACCQ